MKLQHLFFAGALTITPVAGVLAQQTVSPDLKADNTHEADAVKNGSASNPQRPGSTGSSTVTGDRSTVAGDQNGTDRARSGGGGGGGK